MSHYLLDIQYFCLCLRNIAFHIQFYKTEYIGHICSRLMCFQFVTHSDTGRALSIFWRIPTVLIPLRISFSKFFDKYIIFVVIKYLLLLQFLCWMQGWGSGSVVFLALRIRCLFHWIRILPVTTNLKLFSSWTKYKLE